VPPKPQEPHITTSLSARMRAREGGGDPPQRENFEKDVHEKTRKSEIEAAFWRVVKDWPGFAGMPKVKARTAWFRLGDDDRELAERRRDAWFALLRSQGKSHFPAPFTYFSERLFADIPDAPDKPAAPLVHAPFGKGWMALRFHLLDGPRAQWRPTAFQRKMLGEGKDDLVRNDRRRGEFPQVAVMDGDAGYGRGARHPPDLAPFDTQGYVPVKVGSDGWKAWVYWHDEHDFPALPEPRGDDRHVWLPQKDPAGFELNHHGNRQETDSDGSANGGDDFEAFG